VGAGEFVVVPRRLLAARPIAYNAGTTSHGRARDRRHPVAATEPITINVDSDAARAFNNASPEKRRQLELLITLQLIASTRQLPPLDELMDEIGRKSQERGLTPEILDGILKGA
jgi:hypothetical protein